MTKIFHNYCHLSFSSFMHIFKVQDSMLKSDDLNGRADVEQS